ncbi:hypothetical protein [Kumtagia ephedrae]
MEQRLLLDADDVGDRGVVLLAQLGRRHGLGHRLTRRHGSLP